MSFSYQIILLDILYYLQMGYSVKVKVKVKVTLRLTVSQSVCLGVEPKYGTFDQRFLIFFLKVAAAPRYIASTHTAQKTPLPTTRFVTAFMRCLVMAEALPRKRCHNIIP
jgi:hypothetical protein